MKPNKIIISGGGTGGHIYPAIAIAQELERRYPDIELLFVGASHRMEMEKVPQAGYKIIGLWISGIQRNLSLENLKFPLKLLSSLFRSYQILSSFKPDAVVGTGGFASGPLLKMGTLLGIPALIQEQNSYAGITNKWLGKKVQKICVAYDGMEAFFPADKILKTGNPVRQDLLTIADKRGRALKKYELTSERLTLLVLGGSLGAKAINTLIAKSLPFFEKNEVTVLWQTGRLYFEAYQHLNTKHIHVLEYIDTMDLAYAAADIIVSRAGASSVSELCIAGKATVFIPSPNVAEDHQTKNAEAVAREDAAILIPESQAQQLFEGALSKLFKSEELRKKLGANIQKMALPNATSDIVDGLEAILDKTKTK